MRHFKVVIILVSSLVLHLVGFSLPAYAAPNSLAAYSETRSFRDALDGRSMEEAISGPVDKDTSSYGDRNGGPQAMQAPSMMLNIPANGNLQQPGTSGQQQQQQSADSGELEREAGPIDAQQSVAQEPQAPMMEQKSARSQRNGQRQAMSSPVVMAMLQRSGRQQQQQVETEAEQIPSSAEATPPTKNSSGANEQGFGDEQSNGSSATKQPSGYASGARGSPMTSGERNGAPGAANSAPQAGYGQQQAEDASEQQTVDVQQPRAQMSDSGYTGAAQSNMNANTNGNNYDNQQQQMQAAKLRNMAAMMMKYSRAGMNSANDASGSFGDKRPSAMARNAMMSLANKAAYMGSQPRQSAVSGGDYSTGSSTNQRQLNGNGAAYKPASGGSGPSSQRNMRRANQRRAEKKMSPVMVNAMLNKMASAMKEGGDSYAKNSAISAAMQMLKSPAGAEMIAQMLDASNKARDTTGNQMQVQQQESLPTDQQYRNGPAQEESTDYEKPASSGNANGAKSIANYASSTMSPLAQNAITMNGASPRPTGLMAYSPVRARAMSPARVAAISMMNFDNQRQVMQQQDEQAAYNGEQQRQLNEGPMDKALPGQMQTPMPAQMQIPMPVMVMTMPVSKKEPEQQQQELIPAVMMMGAQGPTYSSNIDSANSKGGRTNGFKQAYQQPMQQQQQQQDGGYESDKPADNYGTKRSMARPAGVMMMSQGFEQQQQQQTDEYGSAPKGMAEPFAFDYKIEDDYGNNQYRKEESDKNGVVRGSYGYMDNSGLYRHVEYVADENGFRANIKSNEPGLSSEPANTKGGQQRAIQADSQQQVGSLPVAPVSSTSSALGQTQEPNGQQQLYSNNMMSPNQAQQSTIGEPTQSNVNTLQAQQQMSETGDQ